MDDNRVKNGKIGGVLIEPCYDLTSKYIVLGKPWAEAIDAWREEPRVVDLTNEHRGSSAVFGEIVYEDKLTKATACIVNTGTLTEGVDKVVITNTSDNPVITQEAV